MHHVQLAHGQSKDANIIRDNETHTFSWPTPESPRCESETGGILLRSRRLTGDDVVLHCEQYNEGELSSGHVASFAAPYLDVLGGGCIDTIHCTSTAQCVN